MTFMLRCRARTCIADCNGLVFIYARMREW